MGAWDPARGISLDPALIGRIFGWGEPLGVCLVLGRLCGCEDGYMSVGCRGSFMVVKMAICLLLQGFLWL